MENEVKDLNDENIKVDESKKFESAMFITILGAIFFFLLLAIFTTIIKFF